MPRLDGLETCRRLRATSTVPIIMLTAKAEEIDKVLGLELGSRRLHHQAVLDARVPQPREGGAAAGGHDARRTTIADGEAPIEIGDLRIEPSKRTVTLRGERVDLTFVEFEILVALAGNPGRVFTREALLTRIWGDSAYRDPRTIDVHIRHLREKLELDAKRPDYLFTVRGVGYRFRDDEPGPGS